MWELDHKEGWATKNWCFWTVVLKKTLESPLDSKEIKPVNPKGNQQWICIGRTDAETEVLNFGQRGDSVDKTLMLRRLRAGEEHSRGRDGINDSMDMSLSKSWEIVKNGEAWSAVVHGVAKSRTRLSDWTMTTWTEENKGCAWLPRELRSPGGQWVPGADARWPWQPNLCFLSFLSYVKLSGRGVGLRWGRPGEHCTWRKQRVPWCCGEREEMEQSLLQDWEGELWIQRVRR